MTATIFALATAPGRAAVAVVRLAGPESGSALDAITARPRPLARMATVRRLIDPVSRETLDQALVLWMPGPSSFTGEDVVELHLHGGPAVVEGVVGALAALGLRPAEPGEFTRRAFEHGKLDLTEAEAVADLIDAASEGQRRQALAQLDGAMGVLVAGWRTYLTQALAALEAAIDFPDEDVPEQVADRARAPLRALLAELQETLQDRRGERVRDGYRIALIGAPNAGKSSILNALVERPAAIVTDIPGTTRDVIEHPLDVAGYRVLLADTAGIRDSRDAIEAEGVRRAAAWADSAALRLWVVDGSADDGRWADALPLVRPSDLLVLNKSDRAGGGDRTAALTAGDALELEPVEAHALSPAGVVELVQTIERRVIRDLAGDGGAPLTRLRHRLRVEEAAGHVARALADGADTELMAEDVRVAARALASLTGAVGVEEVLGEVFSTFCIGK